ncbi:CUN020 hypothetical protein [Culex nigripalpus nucleopolyhedrovirus]|uniref:Uncharacterized protein n=1 Tax=Culex nigripalpus nucleopolyhedrovirus (isolate Florida/1997) TaxID=645993 RepID=Q919P9_NPVCO|nr:CUN020 hypothetical protein [Culex nigripalpus nucleopolyhedrovirus]AAK94098.1 CUN020 hypothetical protein [Culex nigripalpus nucleopolyhedrovirus]
MNLLNIFSGKIESEIKSQIEKCIAKLQDAEVRSNIYTILEGLIANPPANMWLVNTYIERISPRLCQFFIGPLRKNITTVLYSRVVQFFAKRIISEARIPTAQEADAIVQLATHLLNSDLPAVAFEKIIAINSTDSGWQNFASSNFSPPAAPAKKVEEPDSAQVGREAVKRKLDFKDEMEAVPYDSTPSTTPSPPLEKRSKKPRRTKNQSAPQKHDPSEEPGAQHEGEKVEAKASVGNNLDNDDEPGKPSEHESTSDEPEAKRVKK